MKISKHFIFIFVVFALTISCKKQKLKGEYKNLVGTWISIHSFQVGGCGNVVDTPINPDLRLELCRQGKYKAYRGGNKVESGRLVKSQDILKFEEGIGGLRSEGNKWLNNHLIYSFNTDTLKVGRNSCGDDYRYLFVKN
ncbi:hypothetical protein CW751_09610 [Brumimicrobium salinarum]|uniref:Lipocalin-like domain-containing protein n=1 Tax=Brumimicrobium salinarum TaxID=2058658 RepID=A0A2I0R218_9FLAO|nr:hypothetical protein [Brumimicrobium salinarum]PKR80617.1 hypothetical protein CW751_09610 [Brumimicrobium salinarum]